MVPETIPAAADSSVPEPSRQSSPQVVDSVTAFRKPPVSPAAPIPPSALSRAKRLLLIVGGTVYGLYALWSIVLMAILPSPTGGLRELVTIGLLVSLAGGVGCITVGVVLLKRIAGADVSVVTRRRSLIKLIIVLLPGLGLSIITPFMIMREPPFVIAIESPTRQEDFVAPVAITFNLQGAVELLRKLGHKPLQYRWDYEGNGKIDEETVVPTATAVYERQGAYMVTVHVKLGDGSSRILRRRVTIPRAVFSVSPLQPIIEKPIRFSISHLISDPKTIKEVQWDFDGDGGTDETTKNLEILHTYYAVGRVPITATVQLQNKTQAVYQRMVEIFEPAPLPFPVTLTVEPKNLIGPAPFGTIFRMDTEELIKEVHWIFGDGKEERGGDLRRVGHVFEEPGIYAVITKVRSESGELAELTTLVRVTETLNLPDLRFDGEPPVRGNTIVGEVPVVVRITPKTALPLIEFFWEAPAAENVHSTGATLQAIYRAQGTYTITLVAQDPEGRTLRLPITVEAEAPTAVPSIQMKPEGGVAPLHVRFDASDTYIPVGETIAGFEWTFGDETGREESELGAAHVEHTYRKPGEYTVTLRVVTQSGKEYVAQRTIIVRQPSLDACILASRVRGVRVGAGIEFDSSCSTGVATSILWDVRLDTMPGVVLAQSPDPKYVYVFEREGMYTITLTIRDEFGNQSTDTIQITVSP